MKLSYERIYADLETFLSSAKTSVYLVAPFIQKDALDLIEKFIQPDVEIHLTTKNNSSDFIKGLISIEAIENLFYAKRDVKIHLLTNLHAKFIIVDDKKIFLGSSNFTLAALGKKGNYSNKELNVIEPIKEKKAKELQKAFEGVYLDKDRLEILKKQIGKAGKRYNQAMKKVPTSGNSITVLEDMRKFEEEDWDELTNHSHKESFLASKESGFKRATDLARVYDVFRKGSVSVKLKEAKRKHHGINGPNTYSFQIGELPAKAMSKNKIGSVMHILKDDKMNYDEDTYFTIPVKVLMLFYRTNGKGTSPHYYIYKDEKGKWYISTKFKSGSYYHITMKLDSFMNKTPTELKRKGIDKGDFKYNRENPTEKTKTEEFIDRIKGEKTGKR